MMHIDVVPRIKTIKMELKPMWETKQFIKPYIDTKSQDSIRKLQYSEIKTILDNYARDMINNATNELAHSNIQPTYNEIEKLYNDFLINKNKETKNQYEKVIKDFKKYIVSVIKKYAEEYQLAKSHSLLFNEKKSMLIKNFNLTDEEKELICSYNGFTLFFKRYFTSLTEVILFGTDSGSIANRIVENIEIYLSNKKILQNIENDKNLLYEQIKDHVNKMDISLCLSQSGIDLYNSLIGNIQGNGINTLISEYKEKTKEKISLAKKLKKIPLGEEKKQIIINKIENDEELERIFEEYISLSKIIMNYSNDAINMFISADKKDIYIAENKISALSKLIYDKWNILENVLNDYCENINNKTYTDYSIAMIDDAIKQSNITPNTDLIDVIRKALLEINFAKINKVSSYKGNANEIKKNKIHIKEFGNAILSFNRAVTMFDLEKNESFFINDIIEKQEILHDLIRMYNMIRNYLTQNPIQIKEWDITFNKSTFLSSFDYDKFKDGVTLTSILKKDELYYLMILNPAYSGKIKSTAYTDGDGFKQLVYKQLTGINKMFPKCFLSEKGKELYNPSDEIIKISKEKLYTKDANDRESLKKWIEFCIKSFKKNEEWSSNFSPIFRNPDDYNNVNDFYSEIEQSTIYMDFTQTISEDYIRDGVKNGEIFLFQIYNKDFSKYHTGNDDPYTKILKELFSKDNLRRINQSNETAIKLASSGSKLSYRPASIAYKVTHSPNVPIDNKNPLNNKPQSVFAYPLCKDKRQMFDSFHINIAVQIGFRNPDITKYEFNKQVNKWVLETKPNILTIRTGEKHLLYYIVSDFDGNVLEENSLNIIISKTKNGIIKTDYKELLAKKEKEINQAKKNWDYSKKISDIKQGYLSRAVSEIIKLQQKYNSIILLEDFSTAFITSRQKNLKNIYQQFQKTLIQRLSCYIPQNQNYSNAIQMAFDVNSSEELKNQSGIVYFINPAYTACTDYVTGFINQFNEHFIYKNLKQSRKILSLTQIIYDEVAKEYIIKIDEKDFGVSKNSKIWELHSSGDRTIYRNDKIEYYDCVGELRYLFKAYHISDFSNFDGVKLDKTFFEKYFEIIRVMLKLHYIDVDNNEEYSLSCIVNNKNERLDTRKNNIITNAAAVKTYLLLKKGLINLNNLDSENYTPARHQFDYKERLMKYLQS